MRLIEALRRSQSNLKPMSLHEELEFAHQDDIAVGYVIAGISLLFAAYSVVQLVDLL